MFFAKPNTAQTAHTGNGSHIHIKRISVREQTAIARNYMFVSTFVESLQRRKRKSNINTKITMNEKIETVRNQLETLRDQIDKSRRDLTYEVERLLSDIADIFGALEDEAYYLSNEIDKLEE